MATHTTCAPVVELVQPKGGENSDTTDEPQTNAGDKVCDKLRTFYILYYRDGEQKMNIPRYIKK